MEEPLQAWEWRLLVPPLQTPSEYEAPSEAELSLDFEWWQWYRTLWEHPAWAYPDTAEYFLEYIEAGNSFDSDKHWRWLMAILYHQMESVLP